MNTSMSILLALLVGIVVIYGYFIYRMRRIIKERDEKHLSKITVLKETGPRYKLRAGGSYLVFEKDQSRSLRLVRGNLKGGGHAIYVTRKPPGRRIKGYLENGEFIWLSETGEGGSTRPTQLGLILEDLRSCIKSHRRTVVHLGALEFLIFHNEFDRVLRFLQNLEDDVAIRGAYMVISLDAQSIDRDHRMMLERELKVIGNKAS